MELSPAQTGMQMAGKTAGHDMSETLVNVGEWAAAPTLETAVYADPVSGWNSIWSPNFTFDAAAAGRENIEGHGHAHVYVNGVKLGRVYGDWYHIGKLPLGRNDVSVSLYANDHSGLGPWRHQDHQHRHRHRRAIAQPSPAVAHEEGPPRDADGPPFFHDLTEVAAYSALSVIICVQAPCGFLVMTGSEPPFIRVATVRS